jgi:hypothetical protein
VLPGPPVSANRRTAPFSLSLTPAPRRSPLGLVAARNRLSVAPAPHRPCPAAIPCSRNNAAARARRPGAAAGPPTLHRPPFPSFLPPHGGRPRTPVPYSPCFPLVHARAPHFPSFSHSTLKKQLEHREPPPCRKFWLETPPTPLFPGDWVILIPLLLLASEATLESPEPSEDLRHRCAPSHRLRSAPAR